MCEIPDCLDSVLNENLRHLLGLVLGKCQNGDLYLILLHKFWKPADHLDLNAANGNSFQNRIHVKDSYKAESSFLKIPIIGKCLSQITCTQNDHGMDGVQP